MALPAPTALNWRTERKVEEFRNFRSAYENYETATGLVEKTDKVRVASLLTCMGPEGVNLFNTLPLTEEQKKQAKGILDAMEAHLKPLANKIYERYIFNTAKQTEDESIEDFIYR